MTTNTSEVLNQAADLIEQRGWAQGVDAMKLVGPVCMEGAIRAVVGDATWRKLDGEEKYRHAPKCPVYQAVWQYLQDDHRWGCFRQAVYDWNDVPGRTSTEVVEVLRACAVIEASREREVAEVAS